ncbi:transmembrane E3 ubiquitin-protein ligase [Plectosphaerella cucumerina]|uniref:DSC E3 ubiquitin ligase complex subunit A n=1 Tax=Plectosphaerella cucumerina TaxID=40658 RepID=A0A8K0TFU2_9PEZI|nr:transmembrane E3 ubiquitin-protein ligase [Plectosphaerella cucumerina]
MPPRQPPQAASVFLFIIVLWIIFSPESPSQYLSFNSLLAERLERHQTALDFLNASSWGDFAPRQSKAPQAIDVSYLNLTGFREEDNLAWDDFSRFRGQCEDWSRRVNPPLAQSEDLLGADRHAVWQNATGVVKGEWVRKEGTSPRHHDDYNLTEIAPNHIWRGSTFPWARNITGSQGTMVIDMVDTGRNVQNLEYEDEKDDGAKGGGWVRTAKASVEIEDVEGSGMTWEMRMHGIKWPRTGIVLMSTTSEKFDGIFGLPHLTPSADFFHSSQKLLNASIADTVRREESAFFNDITVPWSSEVINPQQEALAPSPHCEYILYGQVYPPDKTQLDMAGFDPDFGHMSEVISDIEQELRFPNGAPIRGVPELQMSAILWSPDCSFFLETKGPPDFTPAEGQHLVGNKIEVIYGQIRLWVLVFAGVFLAQVFLLKDQMRESSTPSTVWRISYNSISMMVMLDGIIFGGASIWVLDAGITYLESLALLFAAFLSMTIGGLFLSEIHKVQVPVDRRRDSPTNRNTPRPPATPQNTDESPAARTPAQASAPETTTATTPAEATPRPPSPPFIMPSDQDMDEPLDLPDVTPVGNGGATATVAVDRPNSPSYVMARFALMISFILLVIIFSTSWSSRLRSIFTNILALGYLSFWLPQIHRNIMRNCRRALSWRFMIGQSVLRLTPLAYFYLKEDNFLLAEPDRRAFLVFCAWVWIQLWVLASQDVLGPRFAVPKSWTPEAWDYHPVLREDNLEDGSFPIGLLSSLEPVQTGAGAGDDESVSTKADVESNKGAGGSPGKGMRTAKTECAICFDALEVPVVRAGETDTTAGGVAGVLTRRNYMVTPCRHVFHSACLESWLRYRLKCPICRDDLPPL